MILDNHIIKNEIGRIKYGDKEKFQTNNSLVDQLQSLNQLHTLNVELRVLIIFLEHCKLDQNQRANGPKKIFPSMR